MKISGLVVGVFIVTLIASTFTIFIGGTMTAYEVDYNGSLINAFNKTQEVELQAQELNQTFSRVTTDTNAVDVIGNFVSLGITVAQSTWSSFAIFEDITRSAAESLPFEIPTTFSSILIAIVLVLFIFALVGLMIGRQI
jgi:hypothetical protein